MALAPTQQSPMYGGSVSYDQMQAFRQQQANASFQQNLGRFAMFAGLGVARGIGAGLQATDLQNPFRGAGAAVLGGTEPGMVFANQAAQRMGEAAMFPERMKRELEFDRARREQILGIAEEDRSSFKGISQGIGATMPGQPEAMTPTEEQIERERAGFGRIGLADMGPDGRTFIAQQGLAVARSMMMEDELRRIAQAQMQPASERARNIMYGTQGGMR